LGGVVQNSICQDEAVATYLQQGALCRFFRMIWRSGVAKPPSRPADERPAYEGRQRRGAQWLERFPLAFLSERLSLDTASQDKAGATGDHVLTPMSVQRTSSGARRKNST
jgi:hypothetical protein